MPKHFGNLYKPKPKVSLYKTYIGEDEYLVVTTIRDGMVTTVYENPNGERYIYRKTTLHWDTGGYYITRDHRKFYLPAEIVENN